MEEKIHLWHNVIHHPTPNTSPPSLSSQISHTLRSALLNPANMPIESPDRVYTPEPSPEPRHAPPLPMAPPPVPPPRLPPRALDQVSLRNTILYFTYATNLHAALMAQRCPGSIFRGPAVLRDFTPAVTPTGVVTIRPGPRYQGLQVEGLVYSVPIDEIDAIRRLAPDTTRRRERVTFKPYFRLSGYTAQCIAAMLASEDSVRTELARSMELLPVGEPCAEDALLWTTESLRDQTDGKFAEDADGLVASAIGNAVTLGVPPSFYLEKIAPHFRIALNLQIRGAWSNTVVPVKGGMAPGIVYYRKPTPSAAPSGVLATPGPHTTGSANASGQPDSSNPYNTAAGLAPPGTINPTMGFGTPAPSAAPSEMSVAQGSVPPGTINPAMGFGIPAMPIVGPARIPGIHELYVADVGDNLGQGNPLNPYSLIGQGSALPGTVDPAMSFGAPVPYGTLVTPGFYNADSGAASGLVTPGTINPATGFGAPAPGGSLATPGFYNADSGPASGLVPPGTFNPWTMGWGTPVPEVAAATPGLHNADSGASLNQPNFPNPQSSVHQGTMNPPPGFSTPAPLTAPDRSQATPGLYNADSSASLSQPNFPNPQRSVQHGTMNPPPDFSTPAPPTAPDRTQATPGLYNADSSGALSQPRFSNPDGSVPHGNINPTIVDSTPAPSMAPDVDMAAPGLYNTDSSGALSHPSFSNPDGPVPHGNINPPPGFSTPAPSMALDVDMAAPGVDTADSGSACSQPSFYPQGSVLPESIDPSMLSTSGPSTAHGDFALGRQSFSNPHDSVHPGMIDDTMAPSTPEPSIAPGGILATPSLNTADSGIGMGQPSSSRPNGSTPSGSISRKPEGKMVDQQASSHSAHDSVFPTPSRSTAPGRISNTLTPSTYTPHGIDTTQGDVLSNAQGAVPTGTKRPNVNVDMVGRRTMSSTTQGKMVSRQPSKPAIQRRVTSQSSSSRALDRVIGTAGHSSGTPGTFTDAGGNPAPQARNTITQPAPPAPGARRDAGALTGPAMASHAGPSFASRPPMPPPTVCMAGVRLMIRDECLSKGIPLIIPSLQSGHCVYSDADSMDAIYSVQAMKQLAWTETLADFKVVDVTHDRLLANELALNTLQEVLEAAMKANDEDLTAIAVRHWLKVQEGGDENARSFKCLISDDGLLRLDCVLGEGKGDVLI